MVGLVLEQHFLPLFPQVLEESEKYLIAKKKLNSAAELNSNKHGKHYDTASSKQVTGKWLGGVRFNYKALRTEEATILEIQALLENSKILSMKWRTENLFTICLADGKMINVGVKNLFTGDCWYGVDRSYSLNDVVSDVAYNDRLVMYLLSDGRINIIWKETPSLDADFIEPDFTSVTHSILPNKTAKRCEKSLALDKSNMFVIWWSTSKDDVLPWLPNPESRANIFIYNFEKREPKLLWYLKTSNNILQVNLLTETNKIVILEENADSEGNIFVAESIHYITFRSKENETVIPLQSELTCHAYDPMTTKLALTCCDSSVLIFCRESKVPRTTKATFIPSTVSWHPDSHLIFVAGGSGQYQFLDIALNPILILESNTLSITQELVPCSSIQKSCWLPSTIQSDDSYLLIRFQTGPITVLRLALQSLNLVGLVKFYVVEECISEAINVLKNVRWTLEESLQAAYTIFGHLIKQEHNDEVECWLEQLLAVYFVPSSPELDDSIRKLDLRAMKTLARRFFMWLLRGNKYHRALQIATSLNDMGLFQKLHQVALKTGDTATALLAMQKLTDDDVDSSSESDSDSTGSWTSTESESYPSCQSSEIEQEEQNPGNQVSVKDDLSTSHQVMTSPRKTNSEEDHRLSQVVVMSTSSDSISTSQDSKISVVNFGQV